MLGILVERDEHASAGKARRRLGRRGSNEQNRGAAEGHQVLGDAAEDPAPQASLPVGAHDDQIAPRLPDRIDDAAGDIGDFLGVDVGLNGDALGPKVARRVGPVDIAQAAARQDGFGTAQCGLIGDAGGALRRGAAHRFQL